MIEWGEEVYYGNNVVTLLTRLDTTFPGNYRLVTKWDAQIEANIFRYLGALRKGRVEDD